MGSHQTIGCHSNIPHLNAIFEKDNKGIAVSFIWEYFFSPSATVHNMIPGTRKLDS